MQTLHVIDRVVHYDEAGFAIPAHQEFWLYSGGRTGDYVQDVKAPAPEGVVFMRVWGHDHSTLSGNTLGGLYSSLEEALDALNGRYEFGGVCHVTIQKGGYGGEEIVAVALQ